LKRSFGFRLNILRACAIKIKSQGRLRSPKEEEKKKGPKLRKPHYE